MISRRINCPSRRENNETVSWRQLQASCSLTQRDVVASFRPPSTPSSPSIPFLALVGLAARCKIIGAVVQDSTVPRRRTVESACLPQCHRLLCDAANSVLAGVLPCAPMWEMWKIVGTPDRSLAATQARLALPCSPTKTNTLLSQLTPIVVISTGPTPYASSPMALIITWRA
jgi:hypothetical protein